MYTNTGHTASDHEPDAAVETTLLDFEGDPVVVDIIDYVRRGAGLPSRVVYIEDVEGALLPLSARQAIELALALLCVSGKLIELENLGG